MNTPINIDKNGTTTLATAGKYCDRNIDVNVNIPNADGLLQGTIEGEYVSWEVTKLKYAAFFECSELTKVSLPNCTEIGYRAFYNCAKLEVLWLPSVTTITTNATNTFAYCSTLKEIDLPNLITASDMDSTFSNCANLTKINLPNLGETTIQRNAFANCYKLHTLVLGGVAPHSADCWTESRRCA